VQGTVSPLVSDLGPTRRGAAARGSYHTVSAGQGGYRAGQLRGSPRAAVQQGSSQMMTVHRPPGAVQPQRHPQVARRARGRGGPGPRGYY
jgi:hypothetical protein